jgi:aldose 1-epimerase
MAVSITSTPWGTLGGKAVHVFKLLNSSGAYVEVTNYGATLVSVFVSDRHGELGNVILGFASLQGYLNDTCYIGSTIGRVANRIGNASFRLDGHTYALEPNDFPNTNHGGAAGFNFRVFDFRMEGDVLILSLQSNDGDGGYPGSLKLEVYYTWRDDNELSIRFKATTDKKTVANFTNHAYFNLSAMREGIVNHELTIRSMEMLECTPEYIPTGVVLPTGLMSFFQHKLHERFVKHGDRVTGLNHYYIADGDEADRDEPVCTLVDPISARQLEVFTTYPGVQVYTGDYLTSNTAGSHGVFYKPFDGVCLECQYYPDSPNHALFPSIVLEPGQVYNETIRYKFGLKPKGETKD